jgi:hypothetical protein
MNTPISRRVPRGAALRLCAALVMLFPAATGLQAAERTKGLRKHPAPVVVPKANWAPPPANPDA